MQSECSHQPYYQNFKPETLNLRLFFPASLVILLCLYFVQDSQAQGTTIPLNGDSYHMFDRFNVKYSKLLPRTHTAVKPYSRKKVAEYAMAITDANLTGNKRFKYNHSYQYIENSEWLEDTVIRSKKILWRVIYPEPANLFSVNTEGFILKINPVLHFELGKEKDLNELKFVNTRGAELRGYIKKKIGFYTYLTDNQQRNMSYVQQRISEDPEAVPGEGFYKDFKETGVDYFTARGYVVFNILDAIDVSFGHDKHFFGNGIRSFFLSDYGNNYLFLKLHTTIWRISYTNLFTEMTATYDRGGDQLLKKKYGAFHHLNFNVTHWLDLALFEGVMFERENHFELQYLNPIIFYRSIEQELGSPDNAVVGMDFKANIARRFQLYGQLLFDEFNLSQLREGNGWWANKFAVQSGLKYIDVFGLDQLDAQFEFNWARPYTYTHNTLGTSYTHYNQPLAHPLGANFWEILAQLRYQILPELTAKASLMYAIKGTDDATSNWGGNIFIPNVDDNGSLTVQQEFGNEVTQGIKQKITLFDFLISYQVKHQLYFDINVVARKVSSDNPAQDATQVYGGFGARLNIPYRSYNF